MTRRRKPSGNAPTKSPHRRYSFRRMAIIALGAFALAIAANFASAERAHAQAPHCGGTPNVASSYVQGPWMSIVPLFWINPDPCYQNIGVDGQDNAYPIKPSRNVVVFTDAQKKECYPAGRAPNSDEVNSLYLSASCKVGKVAGVMTWTAVGLVLVVFAYAGMMFVVDSAGSDERLGQMRDMMTGPIIGLAIVFFGYVIAQALVAVMRYNFVRYFEIVIPP